MEINDSVRMLFLNDFSYDYKPEGYDGGSCDRAYIDIFLINTKDLNRLRDSIDFLIDWSKFDYQETVDYYKRAYNKIFECDEKDTVRLDFIKSLVKLSDNQKFYSNLPSHIRYEYYEETSIQYLKDFIDYKMSRIK